MASKAKRVDTYVDCLTYLSNDAEQRGLELIASTLLEVSKVIHTFDNDEFDNDNIKNSSNYVK